ncbi:hypothetical protein V501_00743 [Pseudogymnoascus sp. VKM F-4519 (FW-2642)]|nr:hypothetical protein V501_00743 [Pseudogymnoascus sp. VKM F-4519 (FW-2642)]
MRLTTAAALVALLPCTALAHPALVSSRRDINGRAVNFDAFRLGTKADYSNAGFTAKSSIVSSLTKRGTYLETAQALVKQVAPGAEFRVVDDHYVGSNGVAHVNFKQVAHGLDIDNADFNVNVDADGNVFSYGNSFFTGDVPSENPLVARGQVDAVAALKGASNVLGLEISADGAQAKAEEALEHYIIEGTTGAQQDPKARLVYFQKEDGSLSLSWRVETDLKDNWLLSYVDASGASEVYGVVNYVSDATYQVFPWGTNDPSKGSRTIETDPADKTASEFTWQGNGKTTYTMTEGNNGIAQANYDGDNSWTNDYRPDAPGAKFEYGYSLAETNPKKYIDASVTQLFYTANMYHDMLHALGFNEAAGNFETNNNGAGGKGNDAVILNAQDGSGTNNANFATPPDGQPGVMRMYIWDESTPYRDCSFDAGVIIHEYTHGVSNRLTGGPANTGCLNVLEAGGMGEGWGDFMAIAIHLKTADTRAKNYPMGDWIANDPKGIRNYLYSTSLTTNPYTYKSVNTMSAVHTIGTVWATILYEVLWNLVEKHGNSEARQPTFNGKVPTDGKFLTMKLVLDGMALQPCSPTFVQARDAIIDADKALTGGSNACELWKAFAKRGLGEGASRGSGSTGRKESTTVPSGVC